MLGIFVLSGQAAAKNAGPAVTISFIIAAVASGMYAVSMHLQANVTSLLNMFQPLPRLVTLNLHP